MRTTVEISDRLYKKLRAAATERGSRGFSPIVEEALARYLDDEAGRRDLVRAIESAEGRWSDDDVRELEDAREQAWSAWRVDPS